MCCFLTNAWGVNANSLRWFVFFCVYTYGCSCEFVLVCCVAHVVHCGECVAHVVHCFECVAHVVHCCECVALWCNVLHIWYTVVCCVTHVVHCGVLCYIWGALRCVVLHMWFTGVLCCTCDVLWYVVWHMRCTVLCCVTHVVHCGELCYTFVHSRSFCTRDGPDYIIYRVLFTHSNEFNS